MRTLTERIDIHASGDSVWSVLNDFGGVANWAPYVRESKIVGELEHGVGAHRLMRHFWGFRLEESVVEWKDRVGYTFDARVVPYPIGRVKESWALEVGNPRVSVTSSVTYEMHLGWLGRILDWVLIRHLIRREMRAGLRGLRDYAQSR